MTSNQIISLILLIGRVVSTTFILLVSTRQWKLIKQNNRKELQWYRKLLFTLGIVLLAGQILPITIDTLGIFNKGSFNLLLFYVFSNNLTMLMAAITIWLIYHLSSKKVT